LHEVLHALVGEVLVKPLVVHLDHWCVHARTQTLNLLKRKQAIL
jgi:hypothetical protein